MSALLLHLFFIVYVIGILLLMPAVEHAVRVHRHFNHLQVIAAGLLVLLAWPVLIPIGWVRAKNESN